QQEGERADGAHLRPPLPPALHRPALLHGLRALGSAGHGPLPVHEGDPRGQANRRLQPRPHEPRLHLRRRHRRGRRPRRGRPARARPRLERRPPRPGHQQRPLPRLQHRQLRAGGAAAPHRGPRARAGARGEEELPAHAARRRAGHVRRRLRPGARLRLPPLHAARGGSQALRALVPGVLRRRARYGRLMVVRTADGRLAVDTAHVVEVSAPARSRVLLAGDLATPGHGRPTLLERLAGRLRRSGDVVMTTSSRPGRAWRIADMLITAWGARSHVDVAVVEVHGERGIRRAEVLTGMLARAGVPVIHLLRGGELAALAAHEPGRLKRLLAAGAASVALTGHLYEALAHLGGVTEVIADPVEAGAYPFRPRRFVAPRVLWVCGDGPLGDPVEVA